MKSENIKEATLLIPTKNRSIFLKRVLTYYKNLNFAGTLAIGDSSSDEFLIKNKEICNSMEGFLNLTYETFPDKNLCQTSYELLKNVNTKFVAEVHDDNFIVPESIERCVDFLDNNPSYSAARGLGISIKTEDDKAFGRLIKCVKKKQPSSELDSASSRLLELYGDYSDIHYAIHRTEVYKEVLRNSHIKDNNFFHIMTTANTFVLGKVKELDTLHVVRHIQSPYGRRVFNKNHPESTNTFWWLTGKAWNENLNLLKKTVVDNLIKIEGIEVEDAVKTFEMAFFMYFSMYFANKTKSVAELKKYFENYFCTSLSTQRPSIYQSSLLQYLSPIYSRINFFFAKIKKILLNQEVLQSQVLNTRTNDLLPSLLNKKSKYHKSFNPIYELITSKGS
jgi:glycosyltransferase domain-containing protein